MRISRTPGDVTIKVQGVQLEQVENFKYLGSQLSANGSSEKDIRIRIGMAKSAFRKLQCMLTGGMRREVRKKLIKSLVWSVVMYGSETWTLRKADVRRLEAFEMWIWRRMEKVKWTEKLTNAEVLKLVNEVPSLLDTIKKRKRRQIGHVLRHESLLRTAMEGRMEGKRPRGRKRIMMMDDLKNGEGYAKMKRKAEDREKWRKMS